MGTVATGSPSRSQRILICHEQRHVVRLIQVNLERLGHHVSCAFDKAEAIRVLEAADGIVMPAFDRAVISSNLPNLAGYELISWIRTQSRLKGLWIALTVSQMPDSNLPPNLELEPDRYLVPPFNPVEALA